MAAYAKVGHICEVRMKVRDVSDRLLTVDPCSHPTIFEKGAEHLAALR